MKISEKELADVYRFRAYSRPKRPGMGWFNMLFVVMVFWGGTVIYAPKIYAPVARTVEVAQFETGLAPGTEQELFCGAAK